MQIWFLNCTNLYFKLHNTKIKILNLFCRFYFYLFKSILTSVIETQDQVLHWFVIILSITLIVIIKYRNKILIFFK